VPHLNKTLARFNKNLLDQGFLTGIATINLHEFFFSRKNKLQVNYTRDVRK